MNVNDVENINTPLPYIVRLRHEYVRLIRRFQWEWYFTLTFKDTIHPEEAEKRFRYFINTINKLLYGSHWRRYGNAVEYVKTTELQYRGVIHFHIILHTPGRELTKYQLVDLYKKWLKIAGVSDLKDIENIKSIEDVSRYCSKNVTRDGEYGIEFHFRRNKDYQSS